MNLKHQIKILTILKLSFKEIKYFTIKVLPLLLSSSQHIFKRNLPPLKLDLTIKKFQGWREKLTNNFIVILKYSM